MSMPLKLYIVICDRLNSGMKIAQGVHAAIAFTMQYPDMARLWHDQSNNIVCLETSALPELAAKLEEEGLRISRFHEPDLANELTAIAVEPKGWRKLSNLPLAS